ncbi:MAG TPA: AAA family ATPase [Chitinophaga sp.]|uniref:AAA family ATPase n=1 Tax=Chitinophaga sp. TaxID=1869181 RepID=UPI002CEDEA3F|nr:AAA family ATPase [Chitinophaga sp.]HVI47225.1 AAA family ATPase [Chitinophaga sp.]
MDYIEIQGYKSIRQAKVFLQPINILIGANGSGKSNFISFFEFLNNLYERKLTEYVALRGGEEKMLHKGSANTQEIYFRTEFENGLNGYSATIQKGDTGFIFTQEFLLYDGNPGRDISNYATESRIKTTDNFRAKYVIKYLNSFRKYHFHETGRNSPFNQMSHVDNDSYFLYEKGENLAAFLYAIQQASPLVYNRIVNTIQSIAPFFSDFYFQPNSEGYIRLQWQDKYSSVIYGVTDLSDGTIRFIALTTLFLQPQLPSSIIIDEPELGLHPFAISKLAGMIQSAAARGSQIIAATQSSDLVNHFQAEDIITVDQKNGESVFNRLNSQDLSVWLDEYSIGDLWQRNIIQGGQPN